MSDSSKRRRLCAELYILETFDAAREIAGYDYGGSQRVKELVRRRRDVGPRSLADVTFSTTELADAFERVGTPRLARITERETYRSSTRSSRATVATWRNLERKYLMPDDALGGPTVATPTDPADELPEDATFVERKFSILDTDEMLVDERRTLAQKKDAGRSNYFRGLPITPRETRAMLATIDAELARRERNRAIDRTVHAGDALLEDDELATNPTLVGWVASDPLCREIRRDG